MRGNPVFFSRPSLPCCQSLIHLHSAATRLLCSALAHHNYPQPRSSTTSFQHGQRKCRRRPPMPISNITPPFRDHHSPAQASSRAPTNQLTHTQGARAAQKRDRNAKDTKVAKSQLKTVRAHHHPSSSHLSSRDTGSYNPVVARILPSGFGPGLAVAWVLAHVLSRDNNL